MPEPVSVDDATLAPREGAAMSAWPRLADVLPGPVRSRATRCFWVVYLTVVATRSSNRNAWSPTQLVKNLHLTNKLVTFKSEGAHGGAIDEYTIIERERRFGHQ